jgi:hypothetical protein
MACANINLQSVIVTNKKTGEKWEFLTMIKAAKFLNTSHTQVSAYVSNENLLKGLFIIEKKK